MKSAFQTILLLFLALVPVAVTGFLAYGTGRWGAEHGGLVLGIGLGLATLASLAGLLLFYALSRPWQRLLEGVQEFGRGNLDYRLALRSGGEIGRLVVALNEMAAKRQEAEKALLRINRALRTLSACNEVLVRATEKEHLLGEVCRILVELGGYRLAWVGEALEDGEKTVRPVAWAGCEEGYLSAVRISWGENEWGRGPTGRAIRTGEPVICRDVLIDAHYTPWREEALRRGYRSSIALPLRSDGRVLGALNVYAAEAGAFDPEEVRLLMELADDLAYGLVALRTREEAHRRATHQEALSAIIAAASVAPNLPDLLGVVLEHTLQALGLEMGAIWIKGNYIVQGLPLELLLNHAQAARNAGLDIIAPIAVEDWTQEEKREETIAPLAPFLLRCGVRASITVPLFAGGQRLGGLSVAAREVRSWPAEEVALLEAVGRQLGTVVERLRLEEKTREQAQHILQIMEAVPEGIVLLDASGQVLLANPAGREYLATLSGVREGERLILLGGRPLAEVLAPLPAGRWHEVVLEGTPQRTFEVLARSLGRGAPDGWVLVVREVSAEREMRARAEQQDRLAVMGQIAAGIAHDFANILQGILSFAELLEQRTGMPEDAREPLYLICQMAERGAQMTRQILDFSRQSPAERRPLEPEGFLREMAALLQRTIPESIRVVLECAPEVPYINADAARLQQILLNLATNARDAMPEGGQLRLRLSFLTVGPEGHPLYPDLPAGRWVCLEVADTGCGIPPDVLPHIFEPFFTTKERGCGTGLGLAQVYGLVRQHEGWIHVQTEVGKGTTFALFFPALEEKGAAAEERRGTTFSGRERTVLVVEDEPAVRLALREMLTEIGYRVLEASGGLEALELYDRHRGEIAVVLTDAVMPWMDSASLLQALRERDPEVKVIVVSGYPPGNRSQGTQGTAGWLSKPVSRMQLAETLAQVIGDR